jgi:hypothetical protein
MEELKKNEQFRIELGDRSCEVNFAIKKRCKDFNKPQVYPP